jgi:hypothetical protein
MRQLIHLLVFCALAGCNHSEQEVAAVPPWDGKLSNKIPMPVRSALEKSAQLELLSLDARYRDTDARDEFLRRKVIGTTVIKDPATRARVLGALDFGVTFDDLEVPSCFEPRHAIRVEHQGKSYYLTICFECNQVFVFVDNMNDLKQRFYIKSEPEVVFDDVLKAANIPIAPKDTALQEL